MGAEPTTARGTVIVHHGLYSCKEDCRETLALLARTGFRAVAVDSRGHGAWPDADPRRRIVEGAADFMERFMEVVLETADLFPGLVAGLAERGYPVSGGVAVAGVSMGGGIVYELLVRGYPIRAAAVLISSPAFRPDHPDSPHRHPGRVVPAALLTITAGRDTTVPCGAARAFHQGLLPLYRDTPDRLQAIHFPESAHQMRPGDWEAALLAVANWFDRHLGTP